MLEQKHTTFVMNAHTHHSRTPEKAFRKHDGKTPFWMHPVWCATTLLGHTDVPEQLRQDGALALLYHDVLEDTTCTLPDSLSAKVVAYVEDMTFYGGSQEEMVRVWEKPPESRLLKLYDKVSNLMDISFMSKRAQARYRRYVARLADDVEEHFGELAIVRMARALLSS